MLNFGKVYTLHETNIIPPESLDQVGFHDGAGPGWSIIFRWLKLLLWAPSVPWNKNPWPHRSQLPGTEQLTHGIHNPRPGPKDGPIAVGTAREAGSGEGKGGWLQGEGLGPGWVFGRHLVEEKNMDRKKHQSQEGCFHWSRYWIVYWNTCINIYIYKYIRYTYGI